MRLLLDTHALIWAAAAPSRFRPATLAILAEASCVFVSPVSAYEIAFKATLGKLPVGELLLKDLAGYLAEQRFEVLPVTLRHAETAGRLPPAHRDPFDRILIAQALVDDLTIMSSDAAFDQFGVRRLW